MEIEIIQCDMGSLMGFASEHDEPAMYHSARKLLGYSESINRKSNANCDGVKGVQPKLQALGGINPSNQTRPEDLNTTQRFTVRHP